LFLIVRSLLSITWSNIALPAASGRPSDRLDDLAVLAGRDRHQPAVGQVHAPEQAQFLDQLAVDRGQLAVAGELDQAVVELAGSAGGSCRRPWP
jgi:hypothetical protein